jgi:effector-binding domain-containing protein
MKKTKNICCPKFDPSLWNEKRHVWKNKLFIKTAIPVFFHIPLPFLVGYIMTKLWKKAEKAGATPSKNDYFCLTHDPNLFVSEYYMHVTKKVPGIKNVELSGEFISKVYEGSYSEVYKWLKDMTGYIETLGKNVYRNFLYFTTCPKCAIKYKHNYVVAITETE